MDVLHQLAAVDRLRIRCCFEEKFLTSRMAGDYVNVYKKLILQNAGLPVGNKILQEHAEDFLATKMKEL